MPNRIIRESCRTSPNLAKLSHGAERLFWRLITTADDFGRFDADRNVILGHCFPHLLDRVKLTHVNQWLEELVTCELMQTYVANGRSYGFFRTWDAHQYVRAKKSKYPAPTSANICSHVLADSLGIQSESNPIQSNTDHPPSARDGFQAFYEAYPKHVNRQQALKAWRKIKPSPDLQTTILAAIERFKLTDAWQKEGGQFIPYPASWLNGRRWEDEIEVSLPTPPEPPGEFDHLPRIRNEDYWICGCEKADTVNACRHRHHGMTREESYAYDDAHRASA